MPGKKQILRRSKLYVVLDSEVASFEKLFVVLKKTVSAGTKIVQLRSKHGSAREILAFAKKALQVTRGRALFIVNDRVDLTVVSGSDGVHLGQEDLPLKAARKILGSQSIIGVSCQTLKQAMAAQRDGADCIGFGSVFKTKTKPQRPGLNLQVVSQISSKVRIPVFFIGGITLYNVEKTLDKGGKRVAVTRAICEAADVAVSTRNLLAKLS